MPFEQLLDIIHAAKDEYETGGNPEDVEGLLDEASDQLDFMRRRAEEAQLGLNNAD